MKTFSALHKKRPLFPILLSLLLLLAVSLTVLGAAMLCWTFRQAAQVSNDYVTIAVLPDYRTPTGEELENGTFTEREYDPFAVHEAAINSGFVQSVDYRYILGAEVKGSKAIISGCRDLLDYDTEFDSPCYNMTVFAVKCKSVKDGETLTPMGEIIAGYDMEAEIVDVVSLADGYPDIYDDSELIAYVPGHVHETAKASVPVPATITIKGSLFTAEGEIPFQEGKTYLIYGFYRDYTVITMSTQTSITQGRLLDNGRSILFLDYARIYLHLDRGGNITFTDPSEMTGKIGEFYDKALQVERGYMEDGTPYYYPDEEMLPRWAEYNGSLEDFLASDECMVWREDIIPLCNVNQSSATVILSDNVQSMYIFNTGVAALLEGRFFDSSDYAGKKVCMISAAYAQYNGYKIGDKLEMDFYDTGYWSSDTIPRGPCLPEDRLGVTEEYEIVGIYSAPEFSKGIQMICADTILIPKKSVSGSESFETNPKDRLVTSLILKNGTKESFLSYMEQEGYKDAYICFDQNFSATEVSIDALVENGQMLLWIGIAAFIITAALAHFLTMRRFAPSAKTMRILGIDRKVVAKQAFGAFILIDAIAALLGAGLAAALFSTVTEKAVSTALAPDYPVIAACAAAAFLLLAMISLLCAKALSNVPLLQTEKKGLK